MTDDYRAQPGDRVPATRAGKVLIETRPGTNTPRITVAVGDLVHEIIEALVDLHAQPGNTLDDLLDEIERCRAEEIDHAGRPSGEQYWAGRKREALDELLAAADVAPDPTVLLTGAEASAISLATPTQPGQVAA